MGFITHTLLFASLPHRGRKRSQREQQRSGDVGSTEACSATVNHQFVLDSHPKANPIRDGTASSIHNHGNWGVIAILEGEEVNTLWRRVPDTRHPNRVEPISEITLLPGDIISFTSDAIHSVKATGDIPTFSFSIYGETYHSRRFEYNPTAHTAKNF